MTVEHATIYTPVDRLYLWLLARPRQPVPVGELNLVRTSQGVSLRYADSWLRDGFPLSEDLPLIEHATMTLAGKASIRVARTLPIRLTYGHAVAVRRFDRTDNAHVHSLSARVALRAAGERYGYPELAQLLRRRGVVDGDTYITHMRELFRRMVFNILIDNTDDHEKNHVLLVSGVGLYELSPAFDVLPSGQALGFQQMRVGEEEADSTLANALTMAGLFALDADGAIREVRAVTAVVEQWKEHFRGCGVTPGDIDMYAEQIDRPFLRDQRREFLVV